MVFTCGMLFLAIAMNAQQSLAGAWDTGKENTKIEIASTDGVYSGKTVASDNTKVKMGKTMLKDIKSVGGAWKGKMYSPKKDQWYDAVLKTQGNQLLITVKAGMMSKTIMWKKE